MDIVDIRDLLEIRYRKKRRIVEMYGPGGGGLGWMDAITECAALDEVFRAAEPISMDEYSALVDQKWYDIWCKEGKSE